MEEIARATAERVARESYARLLALTASRARDLAAAEDALADAFRAALQTWPARGIPERPEAWLLTTARRELIHGARHAQVRAAAAPTLALLQEELAAGDGPRFPDERLKLLFVCAHPAVEPSARSPLMLQAVLGLDAARIASAFLVSPATMGQRLVRAKARLREARVRFEVPEPAEMPARLDSVLEAIYAAYGSGWDDIAGADARTRGLTAEALWLAQLVTELLPDAAEAHGLHALILHCEARRDARRDSAGRFVPLTAQDVARWSAATIDTAEQALGRAAQFGTVGRFQLEAAIQSAHAGRARTGVTPWPVIAQLYEGLVRIAPTIGAFVGRAAAISEVEGAARGLALLDEIPEKDVVAYQPYWVVRAHVLQRLGDARAAACRERAIGLTEDPAVRAFLLTL